MPLITGSWTRLTESDFNESLHFAGTSSYIHPITRVNTGQTAREIIAAQAVQFGWPLVGIYISASGQGSQPHCCLHRTQFPAQTGGQREEKLQNQLDEAFRIMYEESVEQSRSNWVKSHIWTYQSQANNYQPREGGVGHYAFYLSSENPPASWWQEIP
jgi:hypothetical protein